MEVVFETFLNTAGDSDNTKSILIEQGIINKHKVTLARLSTARSYLEYNFYAQTYTWLVDICRIAQLPRNERPEKKMIQVFTIGVTILLADVRPWTRLELQLWLIHNNDNRADSE